MRPPAILQRDLREICSAPPRARELWLAVWPAEQAELLEESPAEAQVIMEEQDLLELEAVESGWGGTSPWRRCWPSWSLSSSRKHSR